MLLFFELIAVSNVVFDDAPVWTILGSQFVILPLLARKRFPFHVLAFICAAATVFVLLGGDIDGLLPVMVAGPLHTTTRV